MKQVINKLKFQEFELKIEKEINKMVCDFLGIHIEKIVNENRIDTVKMTQYGLIQKFLTTVGITDCNPKNTPCNV